MSPLTALYNPDLVILVLEGGADPNSHFSDGSTALLDVMKTNRSNALDVLTLLLQHGAEPNLAHAHTAETPLMAAALARHVNLVKLLLEYGADVTQVNSESKSVLDMLGRFSINAGVVELCLQYVDTNRPNAKPLLK